LVVCGVSLMAWLQTTVPMARQPTNHKQPATRNQQPGLPVPLGVRHRTDGSSAATPQTTNNQ
jgi:hypothetical protein